jgi:hypothetical protein
VPLEGWSSVYVFFVSLELVDIFREFVLFKLVNPTQGTDVY